MGRLDGKVAIVTGASSGMGEAITKRFAKEGATVLAIARRKEKLQGVIDEITAQGGKAVAVSGDVTNQADVENVVKTAVEQYGKLDIVVNNAGLMDNMAPVERIPDEMFDNVIDVNLKGPFRMFRAAIPAMLKNPDNPKYPAGFGKGAFVTVASVGGLRGAISGPAYTASKHGVVGLAKNVAFMYAKKGIRSNIIAPGGVATEMAAAMTGWDPEWVGICTSGNAECNPRTGAPGEIAELALFLASDESSLINGATVTADAGWCAQ